MVLALDIFFVFACSSLVEGFTAPNSYPLLQGRPSSLSSSTHHQLPQPRATQTVFTKESLWDEQFAALQRYKNEHGDCLVPISYSEDPKLGSWVHQQRAKAKGGRVTDDRLKHLHRIGVFWDEQFAALQRYKNEHGNCLVPRRYTDDAQLAQWVTKQRQKAKLGKLTDDRRQRLLSIGFDFAPQNHSWDEQFAALQRYKNQHGNCLVPISYKGDPKLAQWVKNQRPKAKAGEVSGDRMKRLESIGFVFDVYDYLWDEQFAALQRYKNQHGDCLVPRSYSDNPQFQLGKWVDTQRTNAKEGKLTDDRMKRLESIGFVFDAQDYLWDEQFAALQRCKNQHGNCLVPRSYSDNPQLASWVHQQRDCATADIMPDDRMQRLQSIGFVFDAQDYVWDEQFAALQRYKNQHGNCLVPKGYSDDPKLAHWIQRQRKNAIAGKMADDRMKRLESIGFVFGVYDCFWEEQFAALQRYKNEHGNCLVPIQYSDNPKLGHWVMVQRRDFVKPGKMTDDRMKRLESIGFVFDAQDYVWDTQFAALQRYKNEYGDCLVPQNYSDDPKLGNWVNWQRQDVKAGKMTDDRMKRLESIGFVFDVPSYLWDEQFAALLLYKIVHGDCLVPWKYSEDPQLGNWVRWQRTKAKAGKLTDDQMKRLESIGFVFDVPAYVWDMQFAALQHFKNEHGNCLVPQRYGYGKNMKLGLWVEIQRANVKAGKLTDDQLKRLESIGFN